MMLGLPIRSSEVVQPQMSTCGYWERNHCCLLDLLQHFDLQLLVLTQAVQPLVSAHKLTTTTAETSRVGNGRKKMTNKSKQKCGYGTNLRVCCQPKAEAMSLLESVVWPEAG